MNDLDQYITSIQRGDTDAFAAWVAGAEPRIRGSLARFAAHVDTEAVLQECLLRIWQAAPRFRPDGRPEGLLRLAVRIARNFAVTEGRRRGPLPVDPAELGETAIAAPTEPDPSFRETIEGCFERLPDKPRIALNLRINNHASDIALAARLNMKLNTFFQNIRRARLHLEECLERHGVFLGPDR